MFTIYQITNKLNGKSYVGFTVKTPPEKRFDRHRYRTTGGAKTHLHNAIRKYGKDNFPFTILEQGPDHVYGLKVREPYWISILKPEYNMTSGGEGSLGRIVSPITRMRLRVALVGTAQSSEHRAAESASHMGVSLSMEHRAAMRGPRATLKCPHCIVVGGVSNMKRWHFDRCRERAS